MTRPTSEPASFLPSYSLDQAFSGFTAGIVSTLCMQPLDLLKVQLQVSTTTHSTPRNSLVQIWSGLGEIVKSGGIGRRGLYRGIGPNLTGNATSWGLYFLWWEYSFLFFSWGWMFRADCEIWNKRYTDFKKRLSANSKDSNVKLNAGQHLLASASSGNPPTTTERERDWSVNWFPWRKTGVVTAIITNPLWVVKTRMYTTRANSPLAYRGVSRMHPLLLSSTTRKTDIKEWKIDGLYRLIRDEGFRGASKGMTLALIGVSNGAIQFMTYEELKKWRVESRRKRIGGNESISQEESNKLVNVASTLMGEWKQSWPERGRVHRVIWNTFSWAGVRN